MNFPKSVLIAVLLPFGAITAKGSSTVDTLVDAAWRAWQIPDYALAEKKFRAAIESDASNERGYVGLALLNTMREKHQQCWDALKMLVNVKPDSYPYIFSFGPTLRFRLKDQYRELGLIEYLQKLSSSADERGVLAARTTEALEEYYRERGDLREARKWREKMIAISDWLLIGPFENVSGSGYDKAFPPETEFVPTATYEGKTGIPASWFPIASTLPNTWIDFTRHFPFKQSIYYANTFVYSPSRMKVDLRVGTSGSIRAFLNDEKVLECFDENNNDLDTYIVATELQQGWNRVLIKCGCSEIDKCNFLVRITDEHGGRIDGLRVSTGIQTYAHKPSATATVLENSFESFFKKQLEMYPDRPENYALLAQLYLRDDKAPQAEKILRSALKQWPHCTLFYTLMLETYQRGGKQDETEELFVKISAIDDQLPTVISHRVAENLRNEDYQKVEDEVTLLKTRGYNPEAIYQIEMSLLGKRKEIDKLVTLAKEAHTRYPLNWEFTNLQAVIESEINHSPEKAAGVVDAFLKKKFGMEQLRTMAEYYLKAGKFDEWEAAMKQAIDVDPTATGYVYSMGLVYQLAKEYPKAEESFRRALALCPNSSLYWSKLAEVCKSTGRVEEARAAYRSGLEFEPRDFASRDALRALENKKPVFSAFTSFGIDSLIRTAPTQKEYQNDNALILLDDAKRVVLERGASMAMHEVLVKVFNTKGIDAWKEYYIGYNSNNEELLVEKAVTIKKDGTEVKADVRDGNVVFKSLEPNECLYLKWKLKNFYSGMLAMHFWDTHYINGFYPARIDRYSLLVPKEVQFTHRTQLTPDEPSIREVADGVLYEWQSRNEPAIRYEQGMPGLQDVAKMLFVSSLPSWDYVANWYSDLARTKTRATFEVTEKVANLLDGRTELSEGEKVRTVYDFITDNIRYSSVSFRQSAYVPQRARDVLVQRLGDCKDVATLCIAMLSEVGVKAHYVLVNTWDGGHNRNIPPSIAFNHCIVGVDMKSGVKYLDLTASNFSIGSVPPAVSGAFSLPIEGGKQKPIYLDPGQFSSNNLIRTSTVALNEDNSATIVCSSRRSGSSSANVRSRYRNKSNSERIKVLGEILSNKYPSVKVEVVTIEDIDRLDAVMKDSYTYKVPQFVSDAGEFKLILMPWADRLEPNEALSYESRSYPYIDGNALDTTIETLRLTLPAGYTLKDTPRHVKLSDTIGEYEVTYKTSRGVLIGKRMFVQKKLTVAPEQYSAYKSFYNEALREDKRQFLLKKVR